MGGQTGGRMIQGHIQGRGRDAEEMSGILSKAKHTACIYMQRDTTQSNAPTAQADNHTRTRWATN